MDRGLHDPRRHRGDGEPIERRRRDVRHRGHEDDRGEDRQGLDAVGVGAHRALIGVAAMRPVAGKAGQLGAAGQDQPPAIHAQT